MSRDSINFFLLTILFNFTIHFYIYFRMKEVLHIYTRVSTSIQESDGTSLTTQKDAGIELSKKLEIGRASGRERV